MSRCFINARSLVSTARRAILLELATTHIGVHTRAKARDIQNGEMRACVRKREGCAGNERRQRTCAPLFSIGNRRQPRARLSNCHYARRLQQGLTSSGLRFGGSITKQWHDTLSASSAGILAEKVRLPGTAIET